MRELRRRRVEFLRRALVLRVLCTTPRAERKKTQRKKKNFIFFLGDSDTRLRPPIACRIRFTRNLVLSLSLFFFDLQTPWHNVGADGRSACQGPVRPARHRQGKVSDDDVFFAFKCFSQKGSLAVVVGVSEKRDSPFYESRGSSLCPSIFPLSFVGDA